VLVLAAAVRLVFVATPVGRLDADEAVTGLMVRRILDGEAFPFYAGQSYMGTVEQYLQAPVLALLPDTPLTLRLVQVALGVLATWLVYRVGRSILGLPRAVLAAGLFAVGPYAAIEWATRSRGGFAAAVVIGLAGLALALETPPERASWLRAAAFGLCCGLGLYTNALAAYLLLPAAVWVAGTLRHRIWRLLPAAAAGALVGVAPMLVEAAAGGRPRLSASYAPSTLAERAGILLDPVLPLFLGARTGVDRPLVALPVLVSVAALAALGVAVARRRGLADLLLLRVGRRQPGDVVWLGLVTSLVLYLSSPATRTPQPRYLLPAGALLAVALAGLVPRTTTGRVRRAAAAVLVALVAAPSLLTGLAVAADGGGGEAVRGELRDGTRATPDLVRSEDLAVVAARLREEGVTAVYADYWLAYPLAFAAGDDLVVAPLYTDRFGQRPVARRDPSPAWLAPAGARAQEVRGALKGAGAQWREVEVAGYTAFVDVTPPVDPTSPDRRPSGTRPRARAS